MDPGFFGPQGPLTALLGYEYRVAQQSMAEVIWNTLRCGHLGLVEAGTGTGKSLAYLYPSICYAREREERVVVSTNTINLQEQLITKDIPFLQEFLSFDAIVVKGWSNYPCYYRAEELLSRDSFALEHEWLAQLLRYSDQDGVITRTELGSVSQELWDEVQAEPDLCVRLKCPFYDSCSLFRVRRLAENAQLVVVNHHLLMADASVRREKGWEEVAVLPTYRHVIFDEAHHIENVATEYFGRRVSMIRIRRLLGMFYRRSRSEDRGLLPRLRRLPLAASDLALIDWKLLPDIRKVEEGAALFFAAVEEYVNRADTSGDKLTMPYRGLTDESVVASFDQLYWGMARLGNGLRELLESLEDEDAGRLRPLVNRLEGLSEDLQFIMDADSHDHVYWIGRLPRRKGAVLAVSPVDVGQLLRDHLLFQLETAVFTSATLTVNESFAFFQRSIGAIGVEWDLQLAILPSPFDFADQVFLGVPSDLPYPDSPQFAAAFVDKLTSILETTQGRAFILFTSYRLLGKVVACARQEWASRGYTLIVQGELPRHMMLQQFRREPRAVLFGTDSFWEGVDVAGEALSCVIVTKLPFRVPTEPVVAARAERIRSRGGNPFTEYFLPQAVLKFRQGVGRLIRRQSDRGILLICDRRLIERSYGRSFLQALPDCRVHQAPIGHIQREVESWFSL